MEPQRVIGAQADIAGAKDIAPEPHQRGIIQPEGWRLGFQELAAAGSYRTLAEQLMTRHYDPLYARSRKRREDEPVEVVELESLDEVALAAAARRLLSGH